MSNSAFAESVFLKDGSIIEGDIVKETDKATTVKTKEGKTVTIQRKEILRTLVGDSYKTKMYIMKSNKDVVPVYIVEEDNESYTCRIYLQSPEEFTIKKADVLFVSKIPPKDFIDEEVKKKVAEVGIKEKYTWEQNVKWRAPFMRFGYSNYTQYDDELEYLFPEPEPVILIDIFFWRFRDENGNGFDIMGRLRHHGRKAHLNVSDPRTSKYEQIYNVTIAPSEYSSYFFLTSISGGLRYAYGWYVGYLIVQPYIFALYQYGKIDSEIDYYDGVMHKEEHIDIKSHGYQVGAGVDVGLFPYLGIFIEASYGYAKIEFHNGETYNVDGLSIYYGVSWRTSYGLIE